jgi:hypothetical protein
LSDFGVTDSKSICLTTDDLDRALMEVQKEDLILETDYLEYSSRLTEKKPEKRHHPELKPFQNEEYVHELLKQDTNCCQRLALNLCGCCGSSAQVFVAVFGGLQFVYWLYIVLDAYLWAPSFMIEQLLINFLTCLSGLFLCLCGVYLLSVDTHKILSLLLANFSMKLDHLGNVSDKLEKTEGRLTQAKDCIEEQTNKSTNLVDVHQNLIDENRALQSEHVHITDKYKNLVEQYDSAIVEQQKILSNTLHAVANLHENGSEQLTYLLSEMSQVSGQNKEVCAEFGKVFLQTEKLRTELTELRNALNESVSDLGKTTKKNHELTDKLQILTKMIPELITERNACNRKSINLERKGNSLISTLHSIINDKSDKMRSLTLCLSG